MDEKKVMIGACLLVEDIAKMVYISPKAINQSFV